jgi:hypothetical protein
MMKFIAGILSAAALLMVLRFTGATPSLESPLLLAELCGVGAIGALVVALIGSEDAPADDATPRAPRPAQISARAVRQPRWLSM